MPARTLKDWISRRAVALELEIDPSSVDAVVEAAKIRVRQLPGLTPRFSLTDVRRVKVEALAERVVA